MRTGSMLAKAVLISWVALGCSRDDDGGTPAAGATPVATIPPAGKKASTAKRAITGKPSGVSTKPTGTLPKPATKIDARVTGAKAEAADTEGACTAEEEGLAACMGTYAVFCQATKLYALDCSLFVDANDQESATCGEIDGAIDCGWED